MRHPSGRFFAGDSASAAPHARTSSTTHCPSELDALEQRGVGERLLAARLSGADREAAILAEIARGELPRHLLREPEPARCMPRVEEIVTAAADYISTSEASASIDVRVELGPGRTLPGTVPGLRGGLLASATYSRVAPRQRLAAWVYLLALAAARPSTRLRSGDSRPDAGRNGQRART